MKTIEVSDEMYEKLIALATEMTTQDPRSTRAPHIYQIREWAKVYDWALNGDVHIWVEQGNSTEIETYEDLVSYLENDDVEIPENLKEMWGERGQYDLKDWLSEKCPDLEECSYTDKAVYQNYFLTGKSCKEHIRLNHYHYRNPDDYLTHAWRNPDMDLVSEFFCGLVGKKPHQ